MLKILQVSFVSQYLDNQNKVFCDIKTYIKNIYGINTDNYMFTGPFLQMFGDLIYKSVARRIFDRNIIINLTTISYFKMLSKLKSAINVSF